MTTNYDVIIIGAGLGGLTAGAKLAKSGKKVLLIEQHNIPGGCATTFKRKGYTVEVGLHEMDGLDEHDIKRDIFNDLDIFNNVELVRLPEFYRYLSSNIDFVVPEGKEPAFEKLLKAFPKEERGLKKYFKLIHGTRKEAFKLPINKIIRALLYPLYPIIFPHVVKSSRVSVGHFMDKVFNDEALKLILTANLCYYHNDPYTTSMVYFSIAQDAYYNGGWYIKGGSQKLSNYLASSIEKNGGNILYSHQVNEVIVENGKAIGVVYENLKDKESKAERVFAEQIISNNAVPLLQKMLPEKEAAQLGKKVNDLEHSLSMLTLYLGFKKTPKSLGNKYYSTFIANDEVKNLKDFAEDLKSAPINKRHLIFVDYGQIDSGLAPDGKSVGVLVTTDSAAEWESLSKEDYEKKKEEVSQVLMERLNKLVPGIKEHIDYYELGTAKTIERYTLNPGGAIYGYAQTTKQTGDTRFGNTLPVKNLHIASAWGFPGGGFTGAIISGYLTAIKMNKKS